MSTIIRRKRNSNYTVVSNAMLNDEKLSAECLGVLAYLIGKPDDWEVRPENLSNRFGCGRDRIYRIINDLIEAGYIIRRRIRDEKTKRWSVQEYTVMDEPLPENTEVEDSEHESPVQAEPFPENPTQQKKDSTNNRKSQRTDKDSPSHSLGRADEGFKLESEPCIEAEIVTEREQAEMFFDKLFWPAYPKRFGGNPKEPAKKKIVAAILKGERPEEILAGVKKLYAALQRTGKLGTEFVPMALTWINRKSWKDDPLPEGTGKARGEKSFFDLAQESWLKAEQYERENGTGTNRNEW
jgi:helix-turn-helix protein